MKTSTRWGSIDTWNEYSMERRWISTIISPVAIFDLTLPACCLQTRNHTHFGVISFYDFSRASESAHSACRHKRVHCARPRRKHLWTTTAIRERKQTANQHFKKLPKLLSNIIWKYALWIIMHRSSSKNIIYCTCEWCEWRVPRPLPFIFILGSRVWVTLS